MNLKETNSFRGIPYADYFTVNTEWTVVHEKNLVDPQVKIVIVLDFVFMKSTWLQGTIESNTKAELLGVYELWIQSAQQHIQRRPIARPQEEKWEEKAGPLDTGSILLSIESDPEPSESAGSVVPDEVTDVYASDEELLFYDCEEGEKLAMLSSSKYNRSPSNSSLWNQSQSGSSNQFGFFRMSSTAQELNDMYGREGGGAKSPHDFAVTIVETFFVLAEFSFWKVKFVFHMLNFVFKFHNVLHG